MREVLLLNPTLFVTNICVKCNSDINLVLELQVRHTFCTPQERDLICFMNVICTGLY